MLQQIAGCGLIGVALWGGLHAIKTGEFVDRFLAGVCLAIGLFAITT